ncbi:MAG TPA: class I SAM-dependent methyltransferase [Accumulibacter sp.]|uniref:class I SAM-dependent methyltransferase n=1 Tax=Accumulibacter sp. TaxID=2053492 RepID=UPI0026288105|nr:class I SAM-dependent methyltransferase [Accumulibacter sp.]HRF72100.1 class I SAM-dependent methyltransferase [Accumulibacter sp.]
MENFLPEVREQYEALPYPPRDPEDERRRLLTTWLDSLAMINHYCFAGDRDFGDGFRVLVAGGGTGDGTIYLAEQLRATSARIVHCDLSAASIAIARRRAEIRGLDNIDWLQASLLELPQLGLGEFDYINCSGVLHHLDDPDAGLRALTRVLAADGAIGMMVYATYGRTGVYQMQELLRQINSRTESIAGRLDNARQVLSMLPATNWFARGEQLFFDHRRGDAGIYDLLLHSQDRSYTVEQLYCWLHDEHGFHIEFSDVGRGRSPYLPQLILAPRPAPFLATVARMPLRQQQAIAELLGGTLVTHSFFLTRGSRVAAYRDPASVPFFCHEPITGPELSAIIHRHAGSPFVLRHSHTGVNAQVDTGRYGKFILQYIDGRRSFDEVFSLVRGEEKFRQSPPTNAALFEDFAALYEILNAIERMLLTRRRT